MNSRKCSAPTCTIKVIDAIKSDGVRLTLSPGPPVYRVVGAGPGGRMIVERDYNAMVNHYHDCKDPGFFKK